MRTLVGKILAVIVIAGFFFGLLVLVFAPMEILEKREAEGWPSRKGVITLSYARHVQGAGTKPYWRTEICGKYRDSGEKFCIRRVRLGAFRVGEGKTDAFDAVSRYPVGREIDVYHAPNDLNETLLEAHSSWREMQVITGLAAVFLLLPLVLWAFGKRMQPKRQHDSHP